jgi:hypothetical protein
MYSELKRKICPVCKEEKVLLLDFGKDITTASGHSSHCKRCKKKRRSELRKKEVQYHKELDFKSDLKKNYGISFEQYQEMYTKQKGNCACCGQHESAFKRKLHVDHCHKTKQVRGLLCTQCNPGIGYFQESIERLKMAITYLEKFKN